MRTGRGEQGACGFVAIAIASRSQGFVKRARM